MAVKVNWEIISQKGLKKQTTIKKEKKSPYIWKTWYYIEWKEFDLYDFTVLEDRGDKLYLKSRCRNIYKNNMPFNEEKYIKDLSFDKR